VQEDGSDLHRDAAGVQQLAAKLFSRAWRGSVAGACAPFAGFERHWQSKPGLAARVTTTLTDAQFNVDSPGDAPPTPKVRSGYITQALYHQALYKRFRAVHVPLCRLAATSAVGVDATVVLGDDAQFINTLSSDPGCAGRDALAQGLENAAPPTCRVWTQADIVIAHK